MSHLIALFKIIRSHVSCILNEVPKKIDVVIHSAGINAVGHFEKLDIQKQLSVLDVNLKAPMVLTKGMLERNILVNNSHLIFISSLSHFVSYPGASVYAAIKDGISFYVCSLHIAFNLKIFKS